ncbi:MULTISPECIES: hypothetical protein [Thioclava]|uniref:hypothetical protein n=1 Tax=Thioclava TaxID=285107 RepID=UPI0011BA6F76|nr:MULTISPECIES: hypothetical protein [Thioclava]|tara:strand:- start:373 stop:708 length:336 start_codon:yes stop_codon:yes gene_type:complete
MSALLGYSLCLGATLIVIAGDFVLKSAVDKGHALHSPSVFLGCVLYAASAAGWFLALRHVSLAQTGVASALFTLMALVTMGVVLFGEKLALREVFGIAMAVGSMLLMARVA